MGKSQLIKDYLVKFSLNCNEPLGEVASQGYQQLWEESFTDLSCEVLAAAFAKTIQRCKFFPKVADIRGQIDEARVAATQEAAEMEWQRMLDLRRCYWSPDMPGGFSRGMPRLSERVQAAAKASGVFTLQDCGQEALHVWGKKGFIDSYTTFDRIEQFLLPDGEIKDLLAQVSETKALPPATPRLLRSIPYTPAIAAQRLALGSNTKAKALPRMSQDEFEKQAKAIREKYPALGNMEGIPAELRPIDTSA